MELIKQVDVDQYKYSGYSIGFDRKRSYSIGNGIGSSSSHIDNKKKYNLILGKGPTQRLEHTDCREMILD